MTVKFPSSTYVIGDDVVNNLSVSYTPAGEMEVTDYDSVTHSIEAPNGAHSFWKGVDFNYVYEGKEAFKSWVFNIQNTGNVPMDNVVLTDVIPIEVDVTRIYIGRPDGTPSGVGNPISVLYKTNLNGVWTGLPGNPYAGTANEYVEVTSLGLASNEYITELKWEFGTIPIGYTLYDLKFNSTILTVDRNGDPVPEGRKIHNVADLEFEDYRGPNFDDSEANIVVKSPRPVIRVLKSASPTTVNDGETTTYTLTFQNDSLANRDLINPEFADLLDAKLQFIPGS